MAIKQFTPEERKASLEKAKMARIERARWKADYTAGKVSAEEFLECTDPAVSRTPVLQFLKATSGIGDHGARAILRDLGMSESKRISQLGSNQRKALLDVIAGRSAK